jgi:hypothetical protein
VPFSDSSLRPWTLEALSSRINRKKIETVVDVGAGGGANLEFYWPWMPQSKWTAIEAWEPYVGRFELNERYAACIVDDVRRIELPPADLYIFGDVLEHMSKKEAVRLWNRARAVSKVQILNIPIVHYHQGALHGNPFEVHHAQWNADEILSRLPGIVDFYAGPVVGAFIATEEGIS